MHVFTHKYVCMYLVVVVALCYKQAGAKLGERNTKHGERGHSRARFKSPTTKRMKILERNELKTISLICFCCLLLLVSSSFCSLLLRTIPFRSSIVQQRAACDRSLSHMQISSWNRHELPFTGFILHPKSMLYAF